jgi:hypothetical protein
MTFLRTQWDRVGAWVLVATGSLALLLGWIGVSGTAYPTEQIPYIVSGGLVGIFLLGAGAMLWISADLRDAWRKLDGIERALTAGQVGAPAPPPAPETPATSRDAAPTETASRDRRRRATS